MSSRVSTSKHFSFACNSFTQMKGPVSSVFMVVSPACQLSEVRTLSHISPETPLIKVKHLSAMAAMASLNRTW